MSDQGEASGPGPSEAPAPGARSGRQGGVQGDTWWSRLYDGPDARDTGGAGMDADDSIDDRFASARAVGASSPGRPHKDDPGLVEGAPTPSDPRGPGDVPLVPDGLPTEGLTGAGEAMPVSRTGRGGPGLSAAPSPAATPPPAGGPPPAGVPSPHPAAPGDRPGPAAGRPPGDAAGGSGGEPRPGAVTPAARPAQTDRPPADPAGPADRAGPMGATTPLDEPIPSVPVDAAEAAHPATGVANSGGRSRWRGAREAFGAAVHAPGATAAPRRLLAPPEPGVLVDADPGALSDLVPDTVLDGARHASLVLRAVSARGGSARQRGEPRGDALLTACFGTGSEALLLVAVGTGSAPAGRRAAREVCQTIGEAVGRSRARLVEDIVTDRRATLSSGLKRLTDRCYGRLRARAAALSVPPDAYSADLRCLLLPVDPDCGTRVVFGTGGGGLFRLRDGEWSDLEPIAEHRTSPPPRRVPARLPDHHLPDPRLPEDAPDDVPDDDAPFGSTGTRHQPPPFRFRAVATEPGDALLLCSAGLAVPLRGDPAFAHTLAARWAGEDEPPALATFLTDVQEPAPAYGDDRTAVAVWHTASR